MRSRNVRRHEARVMITGFVPPPEQASLRVAELLDPTESYTIVVDSVVPLGKRACQITGTYLKNSAFNFASITAQHTPPKEKKTKGMGIFDETHDN
ncbi:MAG: hypothetical protein ACR2KZ_15165 [Segetibacter sp.]